MGATKIFLFVSIFVAKNNLELAATECNGRCELSKLSHHEKGIKNRAMVGHSFRNFTLPKTYDCHVKCFDEKCRCQAFQISGQRCELLGEDRMSAPDDFVRKDGYAYFDMSREYVDQVWYFQNFRFFILPFPTYWRWETDHGKLIWTRRSERNKRKKGDGVP